MKLRYPPKAVGDLQRLYDFVVSKNPLAARKIASEIQEAEDRSKVFPKIGLPVSASPDPDSIRDLYIGNYKVCYQIESTELINVLRIWHNKEIEKGL